MTFKHFSYLINDTKVAAFYDGLLEGKLLATQCRRCGRRFYPPRQDCCACMSSEMNYFEITEEGKLVTFTALFVPPEHFTVDLSRKAPYSEYVYRPTTLGIVQLDNGLRVMGWLPALAVAEARVGMRVSPGVDFLPDGRPTVVLRGKEADG